MKELIKKILKVASANGIQVMLGIILGFLLPQYLSIAAYGEYKTYTLIMSYIGFLNLGFADGIYLEYGGKRLSDIKKSQLRSELLFIFLLESILTIIFFFVAIFVKNKLLFLITLSILPYNISTYFKRMYQATDKLERYSRDIIIYTAINFLLSTALAGYYRF